MLTPAQRHRARALGEVATALARGPAPARAAAAATEYELLRAELGNDLRCISEIQSFEAKAALRQQLAPKYDAWVEGVLAGDGGAPDDILTWNMIWRIDFGAFDAALPLARYVIRHHLTLPDRFDRTAPTYVCEEIAEAALKRLGQGPVDMDEAEERKGLTAMLATLGEVDRLVEGQDIYDQVRAKHEKAQGLALLRLIEITPPDADGAAGWRRASQERAARHLRRALELDSSVGVKKRIETLEREMKKADAGD